VAAGLCTRRPALSRLRASTTLPLPSTSKQAVPGDFMEVWGLTSGNRSFYLGKRVAYVYRAQKEVRGTKIRVIWGKVTRPHGRENQHNMAGSVWACRNHLADC
jgi:hypothetical protein